MAKMRAWHIEVPNTGGITSGPIGDSPIPGGGESVYHDNDECPIGKGLLGDRAPGDGGLPRCPECAKLP